MKLKVSLIRWKNFVYSILKLRNISASQFTLASAASRCREAKSVSIHCVQQEVAPLYKNAHFMGLNTALQLPNHHCFVPQRERRQVHNDCI